MGNRHASLLKIQVLYKRVLITFEHSHWALKYKMLWHCYVWMIYIWIHLRSRMSRHFMVIIWQEQLVVSLVVTARLDSLSKMLARLVLCSLTRMYWYWWGERIQPWLDIDMSAFIVKSIFLAPSKTSRWLVTPFVALFSVVHQARFTPLFEPYPHA